MNKSTVVLPSSFNLQSAIGNRQFLLLLLAVLALGSAPLAAQPSDSAPASKPALAAGKGPQYDLSFFYKPGRNYVLRYQTKLEYATPPKYGPTSVQLELAIQTAKATKGEVRLTAKVARVISHAQIDGQEKVHDSSSPGEPARKDFDLVRFVIQGTAAATAKLVSGIDMSKLPSPPPAEQRPALEKQVNDNFSGMILEPFIFLPTQKVRLGQQWQLRKNATVLGASSSLKEEGVCTLAAIEKTKSGPQAVIAYEGKITAQDDLTFQRSGKIAYDLKTGKLVSWEMVQTTKEKPSANVPVKSVMTVHLDEIAPKAAASSKAK